MKKIKLIMVSLAIWSAFSCGKQKSNQGNGDEPQNPNEKNDFSLSDEQKSHLETWKGLAFKSCNVGSVFYGDEAAQVGIDLDLFKERLKDLPYIETEDFVALLGNISEFSYRSTSHRKIDDSTSGSLSMKAEQINSECTISVNDQVVHKAQLAAKISFKGVLSQKDGTESLSLSHPLRLTKLAPGLGSVSAFSLGQAVLRLLTPSQDLEKKLAKYFGLSVDRFSTFFTYEKTWPSNMHAIILPKREGVHPFGVDKTGIQGAIGQLNDVLPSSQEEPVEIFLGFASDWRKYGFTFDDKIKIYMTAFWSPIDSQKYQYGINFQNISLVKPDDNRAIKCFLKRYEDLSHVEVAPKFKKFSPGYDESYCRTFSSDWLSLLDRSPEFNSLIKKMFSGSTRSPGYYNGWSEIFSHLMSRHLEAGDWQNWEHYKDLEIVRDAFSNIMILENAFKNTHSDIQKMTQDYQKLGISWSFYDIRISEERINFILQAMENTAVDFPEATETLWGLLRYSPFIYDEQINFAISIDEEYKQVVRDMKLYAESTYVSDWYKKLVSTLFDTRHDLSVMKAFRQTLEDGNNFIDTYSKADKSDSFMHGKIEKLMLHAIEEGWLKREFETMKQVLTVAKHKSVCSHLKGSVISLGECIGYNDLSRKDSKILSPKYGSRYYDLAKFVDDWILKLQDHVFFDVRCRLVDSFFEPI